MPAPKTKPQAKLSLEEFIPYKLAVVANRLSQSIGSLFEKKYGIQIPEWRILMALHSCGPLSPNEVVEHTSMDKARVSRAQRRLVELELIAVRDDPRDGRRLVLFLTRKGAGMCAAIIPAARETEAWFLSVLPLRERQALDKALSRLLARSREQGGTSVLVQRKEARRRPG
ncbi:MAG: MarR family winged helix-turn-helix transcriptional regulator [Pseudomonadota bacterium]|jgi:DNA-binding MarR family transcriptional regulator